jgi:hypothetical protein
VSTLRTAEAPPAPVHRLVHVSYGGPPTAAAIDAETRRQMADLTWRAALPHMPRRDVEHRARRMAEDRLMAAVVPGATEIYGIANELAVNRGIELAAQHGPLLASLGSVLDGLDQHVRGGHLAAVDEDGIRGIAASTADQAWQRWRARSGAAHATGRPAPELTPADRRQQDPAWQRRRLRRTAGLARQHLAAALGTIGRGAAPYADSYTLARRRERDAAAREWAAAHVWQPPGGGEPVPVATLRAAGEAGRLHRLGAMCRGLDEIAERDGLTPIMVTLTLPPEWHPAPSMGRRTWTPDRGPEATDDALRHRWQRLRARLATAKVRLLGIRVWEPHQDGCPHAHALLYVQPHQIEVVDRHLRAVCPEPVAGQRVASDLVVVDRNRARGSTYLTSTSIP